MKQEKEKKELTEEEKIAKTKKNFKIVGGCCIGVGAVVIIARLINYFGAIAQYRGNIGMLIGGILAGVIAIVIGIVLEIKARK